MEIEKIMMWYFLLGLFTTVIGIYRGIKGKQSSEPDDLTVFSWFLFWWIYLPIYLIRKIKYLIKGKNL